jgi:conjugal transfer pilus assembly protein TraB
MKLSKKITEKIASKQKRVFITLVAAASIGALALTFLPSDGQSNQKGSKEAVKKSAFEISDQETTSENIRLAKLEGENSLVSARMQNLEKTLQEIKAAKLNLEQENQQLSTEQTSLKQKLSALREEHERKIHETAIQSNSENEAEESTAYRLHSWGSDSSDASRHVSYEIPAGTVVKAVLVSGADCSVAVQKPTGPNMVLLKPLDQGKLPRNVRVALKGSIIIGNALGDLSTERVYIRAERMTLVDRTGDFVETEVTAYVSGEDGREGMRGVVVDRSGQIIARAAFASFLQGIGQGIEATLNNQTIEKLAGATGDKTLLNVDMFRSSGIQGGTTALNKLADYYIKRAEQLQPAIQVAAGRVVDVVFTKTIKVGEKDLKKKLEYERKRLNGRS